VCPFRRRAAVVLQSPRIWARLYGGQGKGEYALTLLDQLIIVLVAVELLHQSHSIRITSTVIDPFLSWS